MTGIFEGIRVLDFTRFIAGAYATRFLADMGADVLKVEPPGGESRDCGLVRKADGDLLAVLHTDTPDIGGWNPFFLQNNAGKKSICVDMKASGARALMKSLAEKADVVVESFSPHVMGDWGLDYQSLREVNPSIVMVSASGFGQDTPDPRQPCTESIAAATAGWTHMIGYPDDYPLMVGTGTGDPAAAVVTSLAIVCAIVHKLRTGEGQHVDTAMVDSLYSLDAIVGPFVAMSRGEYNPQRNGRSNPYTVPMGVFRVGDGYITLQAGGAGQDSDSERGMGAVSGWSRLCKTMGRPDLITAPGWANDAERAEREDEVWQVIEGWLNDSYPDAETAAHELSRRQILAAPVRNPVQVLNSDQVRRRNMVVEVPHPLVGDLPVISTAIKFGGSPITVRRGALLGEHNEEACYEWLGMATEDVEVLYDSGVLQQDPLVNALRQSGDVN
jgi:CoA:oxalate CoA-transferase